MPDADIFWIERVNYESLQVLVFQWHDTLCTRIPFTVNPKARELNENADSCSCSFIDSEKYDVWIEIINHTPELDLSITLLYSIVVDW